MRLVMCVTFFANTAKEMADIRKLFPALFLRVLPRADFFEAREIRVPKGYFELAST